MSSAGAKHITHNLLSRSMIFAIVASLNFPRCDSFGLRLLYGFFFFSEFTLFALFIIIRHHSSSFLFVLILFVCLFFFVFFCLFFFVPFSYFYYIFLHVVFCILICSAPTRRHPRPLRFCPAS